MADQTEVDDPKISKREWRSRLKEVLSGVPGVPPVDEAMESLNRTEKPNRRPISRISIGAANQKQVHDSIQKSSEWLLDRQNSDGHWVAELEADTTLESYFILFKAMFDRLDDPKVPKYVKVIKDCILPEGGWNIYENGPPEISVSVLSYLALKVAGEPADDPDMIKCRDAILKMGGATEANTYTKFHLAFFDQYDWAHVPAIPPEMIFIPNISPVNIYEMSSWSRGIFVPLSIIYALKPIFKIPKENNVDELFVGGKEHADLSLKRTEKTFSWNNFFLLTDRALKIAEKFPIGPARRAAMKKAEKWMTDRFEASGGLGAILPAMMNSVLALKCLGYEHDHPLIVEGIRELDSLEIYEPEDDSIRIQPCHSPVWDTCIATYALGTAGFDHTHEAIEKATNWMLAKEVTRPGDWQIKNPCPPGGWFFEYENEFYPDVDDTIMVMMAMRCVYPERKSAKVDDAIGRAMTWILGMQCADGGWAAFDRDNDKAFLTKIPFADHNAMIDPSTSDITSRTLEMLASIAPDTYTMSHPVVKRAIQFIKQDQCADGSWIGRWGINYMYGTWQVLRGLNLIGEDMSKGYIRKGVEWFMSVQLPDGGWGERADSYDDPSRKGLGPSTPSQTSWALMGLLGAGQGDSQSVRHGIQYLLKNQTTDGTWDETEWTGTGFPLVFYLNYHYYRHYFPLMALAQYERFQKGLRP